MELTTETKKEITLGTGEANLKSLLFIFPVMVIFGIPFFILWHGNILTSLKELIFDNIFISLTFIIIGALVHEFIHGLFWAIYLPNGFKSIRLGISWKFLTPYCHSKAPLKLKHYRLGGVMPGILLGIVPSIISVFTGNVELFAFGLFFTMAAGGDFLMIWLLRKERKNTMVQDHPDKIGCIILK